MRSNASTNHLKCSFFLLSLIFAVVTFEWNYELSALDAIFTTKLGGTFYLFECFVFSFCFLLLQMNRKIERNSIEKDSCYDVDVIPQTYMSCVKSFFTLNFFSFVFVEIPSFKLFFIGASFDQVQMSSC